VLYFNARDQASPFHHSETTNRVETLGSVGLTSEPTPLEETEQFEPVHDQRYKPPLEVEAANKSGRGGGHSLRILNLIIRTTAGGRIGGHSSQMKQ